MKPVAGKLPIHDPSEALDPLKVDALSVAKAWLERFGAGCEKADVPAVLDCITDDGFWRDMLPLTWNYRSLGGLDGGKDRIKAVLDEQLGKMQLTKFELDPNLPPSVESPMPILSFVQVFFRFENKAGGCSGIARLVQDPQDSKKWRAWTVYTLLESLREVTPFLDPNRPDTKAGSTQKSWLEQRAEHVEFEDRQPEVLVIGAGQSGLCMAARLGVLGVDTLCIEKLPRVGDMWRNRYSSLRLHDPVWYDLPPTRETVKHLPYLPFPENWPVYTPAKKLANWLEHYAETMDLNIWTSTVITSSKQDADGKWHIEVERTKADGTKQKRMLEPKIVVWCAGLGGGEPKMPAIEGMDKFKGTIVHSTQHKTGRDWAGKKALVVGACTSAHDISKDLVDQGAASVTMVQRSSTYIMSVAKSMPIYMSPLYVSGGPPTDVADRLFASFTNAHMKCLHQYVQMAVREADRDIIDGLHKVGFKTNEGEDDSGFLMLAWSRGGGYYLACGAEQYIIDGRIKLKPSGVKSFSEDKVKFEDGSELEADVVIFATGFGDAREAIRKSLGDEVAAKCKPVWGLDAEKEVNSAYVDCGIPNMFLFMGNLALCRFNSKPVSLQIKAMLDGTFKPEKDRCMLQA